MNVYDFGFACRALLGLAFAALIVGTINHTQQEAWDELNAEIMLPIKHDACLEALRTQLN